MKRILAIILAVALSAVCLTGCGFFEEGELDEGSIIFDTSTKTTNTTSTKKTSTAKSATVNTETAEINVEKVLLGDLSQEEVDDINGRINWLIGYTNDLIDELKGDTKANKKEIAKHEEEYKKFAEELEEELAAINEKLTKDADSIETIFKRLDWQDFSIKKLANNVKIIFNTLSFYGKQLFNLDKNLKQETADRIAADKELDDKVTGNEASIDGIQANVEKVQGDILNLSIDSSRFYASTADLQQQLNVLRGRMEELNTGLTNEHTFSTTELNYLYTLIVELQNQIASLTPPEAE